MTLDQLTIGQRVKLLATDRRLSQGELGRRLGMSQQGMSRLLADDSRLRAPQVAALADVLGVTVGYLYGEQPPSCHEPAA